MTVIYKEPHNYPRKPWVLPALTKHNLKKNTLQQSGTCVNPNPADTCPPGQHGMPGLEQY